MLSTEHIQPSDLLLQSLAAVTVVLWIIWLWRRREYYKFALSFPGNWGLPYLGSIFVTGQAPNILANLQKWIRTWPHRTFVLWLGLHPTLLTLDPAVIEQVLNSPDCLQKGPFYDMITNIIGPGLLTSKVDKWKQNRKRITPIFAQKILLYFIPIVNHTTQKAMNRLRQLDDGKEHNLTDFMGEFLLEISYQTIMGKKFKPKENIDTGIWYNLKKIFHSVPHMTSLFFVNLHYFYQFMDPKFVVAHGSLKKSLQTIMDQRLQSKQDTCTPALADDLEKKDEIRKTLRIFVDQAAELHKNGLLSYDDMLAEANIIFIASVDTTSTTLHAAIIMLAMHPDVQQRLYEEVSQALPDKSAEMQYEHLDKCPYLEMVLNESMRLAPAVTLVTREPTKDIELIIEGKKTRIPKGLQIGLPLYFLHRCPRIWGPTAAQFDPNHVAPERLKEMHPYSFLPFSKGQRNCIGFRYALINTKIIIAHLINNFEFSTSSKYESLEFHQSLTILLKKAPKLRVRARK